MQAIVNQLMRLQKNIYSGLSDDQEHFCILFLDNGNNITGFKVLFSGAMNAATVDLKVVFRNALLFGARSLILVHNHPSNTLNASSGGYPNYTRNKTSR